MKVIYIADDGKFFDDEFECEDYEWKLNHPYLEDIYFFDKDNNRLSDIFSDESYGETERVVVLNEKAVKDLHDFVEYTGFCSYESINECGDWVFNEKECEFVKV